MRLGDLAALVGGRVEGDPDIEISGVSGLKEAGAGEISFLARKDYAPLLAVTRAAAVVVGEDAPPGGPARIVVADPDAAFTALVERFTPPRPRPAPGVHPTAFVDPSATLGEGVSVGPRAVVEAEAAVGEGTVLGAGAFVGRGARIGRDSVLHPGAHVLEGVIVGERAVLGSCSVLGSDGFGFLPGAKAGDPPRAVPQTGTVEVGNDVSIGAGVTVARARFGRTVIGHAVKIDNLVMIAHNVRIGDGSLVVAQAGVAGSTRVGRGVILAAQSGVGGHLDLGDGSVVAARGGVSTDLAPGSVVGGFPARTHGDWKRQEVEMRRLPRTLGRLREEIRRLRARLAAAGISEAVPDPDGDGDA